MAVTSIDPLRVYLYDNVLMRHCMMNYTYDLDNAERDQYVVADTYAPPWSLPSLRPYFAWGMST